MCVLLWALLNISFEEECKLKGKKEKKEEKENKKTRKSWSSQGSNILLILSDSKGVGTSIVQCTNSVQTLVKFCDIWRTFKTWTYSINFLPSAWALHRSSIWLWTECRPSIECRSTTDRYSVNCRRGIGEVSAKYRLSIGELKAISADKHIDRYIERYIDRYITVNMIRHAKSPGEECDASQARTFFLANV